VGYTYQDRIAIAFLDGQSGGLLTVMFGQVGVVDDMVKVVEQDKKFCGTLVESGSEDAVFNLLSDYVINGFPKDKPKENNPFKGNK
jgi:hypothetical protein